MYNLTESQIDKMKHSLGFRKDRVKGRKHLKYEAFRNHFCINENSNGFEELKDLTDKGLMISRQDSLSTSYIFHVSEEGIKYLSELTGVKITEID